MSVGLSDGASHYFSLCVGAATQTGGSNELVVHLWWCRIRHQEGCRSRSILGAVSASDGEIRRGDPGISPRAQHGVCVITTPILAFLPMGAGGSLGRWWPADECGRGWSALSSGRDPGGPNRLLSVTRPHGSETKCCTLLERSNGPGGTPHLINDASTCTQRQLELFQPAQTDSPRSHLRPCARSRCSGSSRLMTRR